MKTNDNYALILHKLCNQRNESRNRGKSNKLLLITTIAIMSLLVAKNSMAATINKTYATYTNNVYYSDTHMNPISPETSMDFGFLTQRLAVRYCQVMDLTMSFKVPGTTDTYVKLFTFSFNDYKDGTGSKFENFTTGKFSTMGYITATKNYITTPDNRNVLWGTWDFPPALMGKTITLKVTGNWIWDYNNIKSGNTPDDPTYNAKAFEFTTTVEAQTGYPLYAGYNPTTTLTMTHQIDGTEKFTWDSNQKVSKFLLYSDPNYKYKVDSISLDSTRSMPGSLAKFLPTIKLDSSQTYYVQQVYDASNPANSSNYLRYTKNIGAIKTYSLKHPSKLTAIFNNCKQEVSLDWIINDINDTASPEDKWVIERKLNTESTYTVLTSTLDGSLTSFTDNSIVFNKIYNYRLRYLPKGSIISNIISAFNTTTYINTKRSNLVLDGKISCTTTPKTDAEAPKIVLTWNPNWCYKENIVLIRKNCLTNVETRIPIKSSGDNNLSTYTDRGLTENLMYNYRFEINSEDSLQLTAWQDKNTEIKNNLKFKSVISSKGTLADRIQLKWSVEREDLSNSFFIKREIYEEGRTNPSVSIANIPTDNATFFSYDDKDIAPGILYKYTLGSEFKLQSGLIDTVKYDPEIIGFAQPSGTVSGRITYGSGTAVSNVSVFVENNTDSTSLYRAIKFNGVDGAKGKVALTPEKHGCVKDGFSWQAWLKPSTESKEMAIYECLKEYSIWYEFGKLKIYLDQISDKTSLISYDMSSYPKDKYFHASVTFDGNDKLLLYVNGKEVASKILLSNEKQLVDKCENLKLRQDTTIAYIGDGFYVKGAYNGYLDDLRLWSRALSASEINSNYNRYINGNESGLIGYWQFDEGLNGYAFDRSNYKKIYNEHHIRFANATSSTTVPISDQLSIKGITDKEGNYLISGVPYIGEGSTYSIKPDLGTHKFEPQQHLRYVSSSSLVHNGTDFTDKSSFPVSVTVQYENSEYPVEGVSFSIDDYAVARDNKLVVTDEKGMATIDVPIGEHYIKASLIGHVFKNNGRYPGGIGKVIVDENFGSINFTDSTLVTVTGRVAGGLVENSKVVGFGKGKANIGQATITLKPTNYSNYSLNNTGSTRTLETDKGKKIKSTTTILNNKSDVVIKTDSITGEYFVKLPPIGEWTVSSVAFQPKGVTQTMDPSLYNKTIKVNPSISSFDTLKVAVNKIDTFRYNVKQNFIYRVTPTIDVKDPFSYPAFGDSKNIIVNANNPAMCDTVTLFSVTNNIVDYKLGKTVSYPQGKPVFTMGNIYTLSIYGYEEYFDKAGASTKVPTDGGTITVTNEMGQIVKNTAPDALDTVPLHVMKLDSLGRINYQFLAGFPKFTTPEDGLGLTIGLEYDKVKTPWIQNTTFRGIVLGYEPVVGANFVTKGPGPIMPLVVLRDPPGTNSYSYLEKGTEISYSFSTKTNRTKSFSEKNCMTFGTDIITGGGLGFITLFPANSENKVAIGAEGEYAKFTGESNTKTLTLTEIVQTSSSPDFVGSNADVYIGTSTNVFSTDCNYLELVKVGATYQLTSNVKPTTNTEGATEFRYSQNEILTAQIPLWQKRIKDILEIVTPDEYSSPTANLTKNRYVTLLDSKDEKFGMDKATYKVVKPSNNKVLVDQVDSMATYIRNWRNLIARNEESKIMAIKDVQGKIYEKTNISFDAGAVVERSYSYSVSDVDSEGDNNSTQVVIGGQVGFEIAGNGVVSEVEGKVGGGKESESSNGKASTTTFGFVLSDDDTDNRFSLNVYKNKFLSSDATALKNDTVNIGFVDSSIGSYIFELAAGNTSCPYEGPDSTLFFKGKTSSGAYKTAATDPLLPLASGSQALDVPVIDILPINVKTDVPNGREASFSLKLESGSMGFNPRPYVLSVDESTNKDGAIISVDGVPLTDNRTYYISKGQPLFKTLTLKQTKKDVLNYPDITLQLSSECGDISKSKNISVGFVPSCSDLELVIDSLTMNTETGNSVLLKLKNFSQEYTNFKGIKIQYKLDGAKDWREKLLAKKGVSFAVGIVPDSIIPELKSSMDYRLNFKGLDDGRYQVRAMTICDDPNSIIDINNITPEFILVKDIVRPSSMGTPSPSSGILTPEDEIAVTFNEALQTNRMLKTDFEVVGVLNGATLQHNEGLALDGDTTTLASTESAISLQNSSFAIEGWVQTADGATFGNIFSIGEGADKLSLKMNKTSVALYVNDAQVGTTEAITPKSDWQYVSLNYNAHTKQTKLFVSNSLESQEKLIYTLSNPINPAGRLFVGAGFMGKIHQVAVWNVSRILSDLSDKNTAKSGTENSLVGYWPMDEANGKMAEDKVRSRNMIVNSAWFVEPNGKSGVFNGIDKSVEINTSTIPLTVTDNFSLEFWFTGSAQTNSTIFSCGKGIGDIKTNEKLSVGFDNAGDLNLFSKDVSYVIPNVTVLDGNWHHFAMSVSRNGNTNLFVDGQQRLQIPSVGISGLVSAKMTIGARSYYDNNSFVKDQYFNGKIDEVRIWKTALTSEIIRLDMRSKLDTASAAGLIAYYPFEKPVNADGKLVEASLEDASKTQATAGVATNMVYSDITPGIKMSRQKVEVNFDYTASDNKIVFTVTDPLKKIENCILEFAIKKVLDMNGNELTEPMRWTAFVNNNRLNWETEQVSMTKQVLAAQTFKATIVNKSGKYENYVVDGLPSWLRVNKTSGRLNPLEKAELSFTVDNSINVGSYESRVALTGNNGIQDMLPIALKVTGPRPDWAVNPYDFESSMNVIGQIQIEGVYQEDNEDILAAFIGTRCVGLANPQFDKTKNSYVLFMDVYGNSADNGQALTFSLWDAGTGRIYPAVDVIGDSIKFVGTTIDGTIDAPRVFNATDKIEQQISLKQGWNWMSTNVVSTNPTLINQFKLGIETAFEQLKSRDGYLSYSDGKWIDSDSEKPITIDQVSMYLLKTNQSKTIKMQGAMAKPADLSIPINSNWNWIGYVPQFVAPIKDALGNLTAVQGDQIKGQIGFATYSGGNWYGSLQYMMPGAGYMYKSMNSISTSFKYPSQYFSQSKVAKQSKVAEKMRWTVDANKFQMSMTATCIASINNLEVANSDMQVAVFIGDECRGTASLKYVESYNRYMAFIMVWGNVEDVNKKITFKSFNTINNQELSTSEQSLTYLPDNIVGSPVSPYQINFVVAGFNDVNMDKLKLYPNPVSNVLYFDCNTTGIERLEVIDNVGRTLIVNTQVNNNSINVSNLVPGVYTIRIKQNGNITNHKFVRK